MGRQIRTLKECKPGTGTHELESPHREIGQDTDRIPADEGTHVLESPDKERKSGHRMNPSLEEALTSCRAQKEKQVVSYKE
jgi:hypothetical protein